MGERDCDVAIVGGDIAGLSLGKFLAEKGIPFVLYEKRDDFFGKACGEGFIQKTCGHDFFDLYGSTKGIENEVWETVIHTRHGDISLEMPVIITDKKKIEAELARQAFAGGDIHMGEAVTAIKNGKLVPQHVRPKIIVGADGCPSLVREHIGVRQPRCGIAAAGYSSEVDLNPDKLHVVMGKDLVRHGYAWYFPKKHNWNIGIGSEKNAYFREAFARFKQANPAEGWRAAPLPFDRPLISYRKNVLLLGDAASHVIYTVGEGNTPAMIAAKIAADVIEQQARRDYKNIDLSEYHRTCMDVFGKYLRRLYLTGIIFHKVIWSERIRYRLLQKMCRDTSAYYARLWHQ